MSEWMDIETAPRDGTEFDAWTEGGYRLTDVKWGSDDYWSGAPCFLVYRRDNDEPHRDMWQDAEEWTRLTHWMPLPNPPEAT